MRKCWILIAIASLTMIFVLAMFVEHQVFAGNSSQSWMFKGAYAIYDGQIESFSGPYNITAEIQVTNLNASHVQIQTTSTIATSFTPTLSDKSELWISKANISFQPEGETLTKTYSTQIIIKNIGVRACKVYEYTNEAINATYCIDKVLVWPIRIIYATVFEDQTYTMEFNIKETNIKGLSQTSTNH